MRTIVLMVMCLSAVQDTARTADAPTVLLDNARVRVLRLSTSLPLTDHPAAVIVPLEDGAFGKAGDAFWSGNAPVRPAPGPGGAASLMVIELKAPSSSGLPALPVAAGSRPGEGTFVGLSFKPLFENARVAVIRGRMEKGATEGVHTHASDIVLVHLSGGVIEDTANGQTKVNRWTHGDVELETRGSSHSARNLGPAVDAVLVTLKP